MSDIWIADALKKKQAALTKELEELSAKLASWRSMGVRMEVEGFAEEVLAGEILGFVFI